MKKFTTLIVILLLCAINVFAQAPEKFTYQALVRNASNALVANAQVGVQVSILQESATGNAVYSESHVATTNANGLITVNIGGGTVQQGIFADIDWANGPYFLKTDIDPNGGNDYSITSVQQLLSVPYALYAKEAANSFSGDYNDLTNTPEIPTLPTNVSAFTNDAGYLTNYTETDPTVPAWAKEANKPTYSYSEIANTPNIPTVPTNVSAFTNDAGYLTNYTETDPQFNAWDKNYNDLTNKPVLFDGDYNSLTNKPTIPTVPTNVSAFTNDAGYLTNYTETDPTVPAWAKEANKPTYSYSEIANTPTIPTVPTNVSAFTNDAGYITMDSIPATLTVPTNVSAFTNDAGYLTNYTETDPQFIAWDKNYNDLTNKPVLFDGDYNSLTNKPTIPTVPTNVNAFTNDAGYLTNYTETDPQFNAWDKNYNDLTNKPVLFDGDYNSLTNKPTIPTVPTNVSAFTNDAGYLTNYTETDPTVPAWAKEANKPAYNYSEIANTPTIPTVPTNVSAFTNDAGYITMDSIPAIPTVPTNVSAFTNDAGYLTNYTETDPQFNAWDKNYNDLTNTPTIPTVPTNVSAFTNDVGYITMDSIPEIPTVPTEVSVFNNDAGYITTIALDSIMAGYIAGLQGQIDSLSAVIDSLEAMQSPGSTVMLPVVTTDAVTVISSSTATGGGTVTSPDGTPILSRGLCWSQHQNPTIDDNVAMAGMGQGHFTADLTGLSADSLYYVRAFAATAHGVAYGQPRVFVSGNSSAITVTVHFASSDTAKGTVTPTDTTVVYGGSITFPNVTAARGWRFSYWMQEGDTTHYTANDHPQVTATATYVAYFGKDVQYSFPGSQEPNTWYDAHHSASDLSNAFFMWEGLERHLWDDYSNHNSTLVDIHIPTILNSALTQYDSNGLKTYINTNGIQVDVYTYGTSGWAIDPLGFNNTEIWESIDTNIYWWKNNNIGGKATIALKYKD